MTAPLVLTLPLPDSRNAGKRHAHWATVYKRTQAYYAACARCTVGIVWPQWEALTASAIVYPRGSNDEGNLMARLKPLEDWIVRQGVVPSDKPKHWHWEGIPVQIVQRQYPAYLVLTLNRASEHKAAA